MNKRPTRRLQNHSRFFESMAGLGRFKIWSSAITVSSLIPEQRRQSLLPDQTTFHVVQYVCLKTFFLLIFLVWFLFICSQLATSMQHIKCSRASADLSHAKQILFLYRTMAQLSTQSIITSVKSASSQNFTFSCVYIFLYFVQSSVMGR